MAVRERWKTTGLIRGLGIPAPTGRYTVGCVDLMQKLEGDNDGLLVRLFYPTIPQIQEGAGYQYAKWTPHKRYTKGFLEFYQFKLPGILSAIANLVLGISTIINFIRRVYMWSGLYTFSIPLNPLDLLTVMHCFL